MFEVAWHASMLARMVEFGCMVACVKQFAGVRLAFGYSFDSRLFEFLLGKDILMVVSMEHSERIVTMSSQSSNIHKNKTTPKEIEHLKRKIRW